MAVHVGKACADQWHHPRLSFDVLLLDLPRNTWGRSVKPGTVTAMPKVYDDDARVLGVKTLMLRCRSQVALRELHSKKTKLWKKNQRLRVER